MPQLEGNLFAIDLQAARAAFQSVPWVRSAVVRRVWPNRLAVQLEEHQVAALWGTGEGVDRLVDSHGELFDANLGDVEDEELPTLSGPESSAPRVFAMYTRLSQTVQPLQTRIESLALSGRGSWRMTLDSGARIELGRGSDDEVLARTALFVRTLPQLTARYERPLLAADLRHRDGYAVQLKGVVTLLDIPPGAAPGAKPTDRR
jgi:cell division protein FtsQ